jgi:PAS domain S-box-containing protein
MKTKDASQNDGSAWQIGFYHKRKDGSVFPVSLSRSVIQDKNGNEIAVVGITRDISNRIHVEDELKKANKELK